MRLNEYYSGIVRRDRRGGPSYQEAKQDLSAAVKTQIAGFQIGY